MPTESLARYVFFKELVLEGFQGVAGGTVYQLRKKSDFEVCPRCANTSSVVYDHRTVRVKDEPIRGKFVVMQIRKRRLMCKPCNRPFTEPISGISKGHRTTERFQQALFWAAKHFSDLKKVRDVYRCSGGFLYKTIYEQLERQRKERLNYPWPKVIGIDEHLFKRSRNYTGRVFATIIVDYKGRRPYELVEGKSGGQLHASLQHIPGRENVSWVNMDMCPPYRSFVRSFFPRAQIVADKFHVLRLLNGSIIRRRKEITGDKRNNPIRRLLLRRSDRLSLAERSAMWKWLSVNPDLRDIYQSKEALYRVYRVRGYKRARKALNFLILRLGESQIAELKTLRNTLMNWKEEILNYFRTGLTNARVEGFNNKAMIVRTRGYGYRSFKNYRLRVLNA